MTSGRAWLTVLAFTLAMVGCKERRRTRALESLVVHQEAPAYAMLESRARALRDAAGQLADAPSETTLSTACARWQEALGAWSLTFPFRPAALTERAPHFHATFWPSEPRLLQAALASDQAIDQRFVDQLGVSAKGMYALEALLFATPRAGSVTPLAALQAAGTAGVRRRALLRALAEDVAETAHAAAATVVAPAFPSAFAREGQAALNRLVNDQVAILEGIVTERLAFMLGASDAGSLPAIAYQGRVSASSSVITQNLLRGVATIYAPTASEGGLSRLVRATSDDADRAVRTALDRAVASVEALGGPLERAVTRDRAAVERAAGDVRALEVAFKTNVASALGITLTFTAGDGD